MKRLKKGRFVVNQEEQIDYIPSREVSYGQLSEADWDLAASIESVDDVIIRKQLLKTLEKALRSLNNEEWELIREIFYLEKSEREVSATFHISQAAIHKRKKKIPEKLKKFFE